VRSVFSTIGLVRSRPVCATGARFHPDDNREVSSSRCSHGRATSAGPRRITRMMVRAVSPATGTVTDRAPCWERHRRAPRP
jgi:hypothetical protein